MATQSGKGRPPLPPVQTPYTHRLTDLTVVSDGWYKPSRTLELIVDGQPRTAVFQRRKSDLSLQWTVTPSVVISPTAIAVIQPYEARTLIRRKKAEAVTILGDAVARACANKPGEKHEYMQRAKGFRVTLGITSQREARTRDPSQSLGNGMFADTPGEHGDVLFGPHTAPNSFKRSMDALHELKKLLPADVASTDPFISTRTAFKAACNAYR
ncbi:hypothetical protein BV25DRAFT_1536621 [Artomyces pyxidatus]|uniref:Uncharacterized protein n=1 Tax=Artomyces pyxidatus TaxID=48021 RepID=A0ACB8SM92_9AGAM|nr:hypothetical protein BV25DRAFT_1536621 [Artomyces pyxidatus]